MDELNESARNIENLLTKVLAVLKLANNEKIVKTKEKLLQNETKRKIYELCDGKHTVKDIVETLKITQPNASYHLASLLESGLVLYEDIGGNRYYSKTLE